MCFFIGFYSNDDEWTMRRKKNDDIIKKNLGQLLCISIMAAADTPKGNVSLVLLYIIFPVTSISRESKIKYDNFIIIINFTGQTRCYASDWWLVARKLYRFKTSNVHNIMCKLYTGRAQAPLCYYDCFKINLFQFNRSWWIERLRCIFFSDHFFKYLFWKCMNNIIQYFKFFYSMNFSGPVS